MSNPDNMQLFDIYTAEIFTILYDNFPIGQTLEAAKLVEQVGLIKTDGEQKQLHLTICGSTLEWLHATNYIMVPGNSDPTITDTIFYATLTPQAFLALRKTPDSLGPSLGQKIKDGLAEASSQSGRAALNSMIGEAISGAMRGLIA